MSKPFKVPSKYPEWFFIMNINGYLVSDDIVKLFEFSDINSIKKENFPTPDDVFIKKMPYKESKNRIKINRWKKSTILKEIKRREEHNKKLNLKIEE